MDITRIKESQPTEEETLIQNENHNTEIHKKIKNKKFIYISVVSAIIALTSVVLLVILIPQNINNCMFHNLEYTKILVQPTCTTAGEAILSCTECRYRKKATMSIRNHAYADYECVVCGDIKASDSIVYGINKNNKTAYVKSISNYDVKDVIISDMYEGYPVTEIGKSAFSGTRIEYVKIPNTVTTIKEKAFFSCKNLNKISFGTGLTTIEKYSFAECGRIYSIVFPDKLYKIGESAFQNTKINHVLINEYLVEIEKNAFTDCSIQYFEFNCSSNWSIETDYEEKVERFYAYSNVIDSIRDYWSYDWYRLA